MCAVVAVACQILSQTTKSKGPMAIAADGLGSRWRTELQVTSPVCLLRACVCLVEA